MVDTWNPRVAGQRSQAFGVGGKGIPGLATGLDDCVVVVEDTVRQEAFAQVQPNAFDRV